jgi:hypothetical protein
MPAQPDNTWKVQLINPDGSVAGNPATFASLGLESAKFEFPNLAADTLTFTVGGKPFDAAQLWNYGQLVAVIHPNGSRFFFGRVEPWDREGTDRDQNHFGCLVNPWWYLERKIYEQTFRLNQNFDQNGKPVYYTATTPRVILNILYDANRAGGFYSATTGQQIADAITWAISQGAPIALGTVDPSTLPFSDPQKGIFCSDVIKLQFRKEPDFVVDWDYSTLPFPTIHFRKQASFKPINIDLTNTTIRDLVKIKERPDWLRSYVRIVYDQTNNIGGVSYLNIGTDLYPNPKPPGTENNFSGVDLFCDLAGGNTSFTQQTSSFASLPFDHTNTAQWQAWMDEFNPQKNPEITNIAIYNDANHPAPAVVALNELDAQGNVIGYDNTCTNEVTKGQWCDWVPNTNAQTVRATAWLQVTRKKGAAAPVTEIVPVQHDFTAINLNTNGIELLFKNATQNITQYAEPQPVGLAQAMWTSWNNLTIEGSFRNVEAVIGYNQTITRSNALNFITANPGLSGRPDWRAVNARVQRITGDLLMGITSIEFGAPLRINGNDLIDAIRATRYRVTTIDINYFFGGASGGGGSLVTFGRKSHVRHSHASTSHKQSDIVSQAPQPVAGQDAFIQHTGAGVSQWVPPNAPVQNNASLPQVTVDPSRAKGGDGNWHPLSVQEVKVMQYQSDGTCKQRTQIFLCSEVFKGAGDPN